MSGSYGKLNKNKSFEGFRKHGLERYSVTFIDNHDTFDRDNAYGNNQFGNGNLSSASTKNQVLQASAYMLMMPGVPCVFYPHWKSYQSEISELIAVRKRAGIHSESPVLEETSGQYQYSATIQGHRGRVVVRVGKNRNMNVPEGFEVAVEGGERGAYTVYFAEGGQGTEDVQSDKVPCTKVIKDGQLYLMYNGTMYDVQGRRRE